LKGRLEGRNGLRRIIDFAPEGPSIVILKEEANRFLGKTIARVEGNTTIEKARLVKAHLDKTQRRSFFCERCQVRYE